VQIYAASAHQQRAPILIALFLVAAALWLTIIIWARDMESMSGTMGLGLAAFVVVWALMMAAMMLPSSYMMISLYARTLQIQRNRRLATFVGGYVLAWSLTGIPAFALAWIAGRVTMDYPGWAAGTAALIFATTGVYQLTSLKDRCLRHCRTPISHLLHYSSYRGRFRDLRAGLHHGLYCLGCCWGLMVLMVAFGVMNLAAMIVLAGVVALEKQWSHGEKVSRVVGVVSLILAVGVIFIPDLAPGLQGAMMDSM
jgi:predicted metal-binding membrane protein